MNPRALISALYSVEVVLREAQILRPDEDYVVELTREAGRRLERWLSSEPLEEMVHGAFVMTVQLPHGDARREITLRGIKVRWPLSPLDDEPGPLARMIETCNFHRRVPRYEDGIGDESSGC